MKQEDRNIIPYALIQSLNCLGNIYEARLFSWILAKAQCVLKYYNKDLGNINIQYALNLARVTLPAKLLLAPGDDNYKNISKSFTLANKTIEYTSSTGNLYRLNIIAFPEYYKKDGKSYVTFVIHNQLWHAILDNFRHGYRIVNLLDILSLTSKYSVILYLLLSQQKEYVVSVQKLRTLLGASSSYNKWNNFQNRIINTAIRDIESHTNCRIHYTTQRAENKKGCPVDSLNFSFEYHPNDGVPDSTRTQAQKLRCNLDEEVQQELTRIYEVPPARYDKFEPLLSALGGKSEQLTYLDKVCASMRKHRVRNKAGYLYKSLR